LLGKRKSYGRESQCQLKKKLVRAGGKDCGAKSGNVSLGRGLSRMARTVGGGEGGGDIKGPSKGGDKERRGGL